MSTTTTTTRGTSAHVPAILGVVRRRVTVAAPPSSVFALLTDPRQHAALDGSDSVQGVIDGPDRLALGSEFRMQMKGYTTLNRVVELEEDRLIAWRHRARHIWRWELRAVTGGTEVTESFGYTAKRLQPVVRLLGVPARADRSLDATLTRLQARFA